MEKQISIIIPTYNMEAYIGKCLDSLIIPEFDAVEVLVVNDGSKDRSSEIAHSYADRYPASIRVIDKPNGNYGSCINAALPLATGRYVKILDADDTFDTDAFSRLLRLLPTCSEDAIITSYIEVNESGVELKYHGFEKWDVELDKSYEAEHALTHFLFRYMDMHRILYSYSIFKSLDYRQTEGISYTDTEWSIIPLSSCKSIRNIDIPVYKYLVGRSGQTMAPEVLERNIGSLFKILKKLIERYNQIKNDYVASSIMYSHIRNRHKYIYLKAIQSQSVTAIDSMKDYDKWLQWHNPDMYEAIGDIDYYPGVSYKIFSVYRDKGYPYSFSPPIWIKCVICFRAKLERAGFTR